MQVLMLIVVQFTLLNILNSTKIAPNVKDTLVVIQDGAVNHITVDSLASKQVTDSLNYNGTIIQEGENNQVELKENINQNKKSTIKIKQTGNNNRVSINNK